MLLRHCNAVYNQNTTDRWTKRRKSPELSRYNPYIHIQCSTTQPHRTENRDNTYEKPKWLSTTSQILTIRRILEGVRAKNLPK